MYPDRFNPHEMDQSLQNILHLYGEADGVMPVGDPEAQVITEARFWMDHRPRVRPDAATLDAIFEAARKPPVEPGLRRPDRAPVARRRTRRASVLVGLALSLAAAVVVLPPGTAEAPHVAEKVSVEPRPETPVTPVASVAEPVEAEVMAPAEVSVTARPAAALAWEPDRSQLDAVARKTAELRAQLDSTLWDAPGADLTLSDGGPGVFTQAASGGQ